MSAPERKPLTVDDLSEDARDFVSPNGFMPHPAAPAAPPARVTAAAIEGEVDLDERHIRFTVDIRKSLHMKLKRAAMDRSMKMTELARVAIADYLAGLD